MVCLHVLISSHYSYVTKFSKVFCSAVVRVAMKGLYYNEQNPHYVASPINLTFFGGFVMYTRDNTKLPVICKFIFFSHVCFRHL